MYKYSIEYKNEESYRKKERTIKKYNMLAYKKLYFEIYPELKSGNFKGTKVFYDNKENIEKYELKLPTDSLFEKVHGPLKLHYSVFKSQKIILLDNLTPEDILLEGHQKELTQYKGVMVSKNHRETDMFKINLLNMLNRD